MDWLDDSIIAGLGAERTPLLSRLGLRFQRSRRDWQMLWSAGMLDCIPIGSAWNGDRVVARVEADGDVETAPLCLANVATGATQIVASDASGFVRAYVILRLMGTEPGVWEAMLRVGDTAWDHLAELDKALGGPGDNAALQSHIAAHLDGIRRDDEDEFAAVQVLSSGGGPRAAFHDLVTKLERQAPYAIDRSALAGFTGIGVKQAAATKTKDVPTRVRCALEAATHVWGHDAAWMFPGHVGDNRQAINDKRTLLSRAAQFLAQDASWDRDGNPGAVALVEASSMGWDSYAGLAHARAAKTLSAAGDHANAARAVLTTAFWAWTRTGQIQDSTVTLLRGLAEEGSLTGLERTLSRVVDEVYGTSTSAVPQSAFGYRRLMDVLDEGHGMTPLTDEKIVEFERAGGFSYPPEWRGFLLTHGAPTVKPRYRSGELSFDPELVAEFHQQNPAVAKAGRTALAYVEGTGHTVQQDLRSGEVTHRDRSRFDWIADDIDGFCEQLAVWIEDSSG